MHLTSPQIDAMYLISDGTDVDVHRVKGQNFVEVHRLEDNLIVRIRDDGAESVMQESKPE